MVKQKEPIALAISHSIILTTRPVNKVAHTPLTGGFLLLLLKSQRNFTMIDPRFEDEAISLLMEEALSETTEDTKFDVEKYIENSDFDW